jgi:hypothetical protein
MPSKLEELTGFTGIDEFAQLPREEVIQQSLARPQAPGALSMGKINNISKARMRHKFAEVLALEVPHIQEALRTLQAENPKVYLEKVMELAEFSLPKLKSVEIDVSANAESAKNMTIADLQAAMQDDSVVAVQ